MFSISSVGVITSELITSELITTVKSYVLQLHSSGDEAESLGIHEV